jgi:hypothetical protein
MDQTDKTLRRQAIKPGIQSCEIQGLSDRDLNNLVSDLLAEELTSKKEVKK